MAGWNQKTDRRTSSAIDPQPVAPPDVVQLVRHDGALRRRVHRLERDRQEHDGPEEPERDGMRRTSADQRIGAGDANRLPQIVEPVAGSARASTQPLQPEQAERDPAETDDDAGRDDDSGRA